MKAGGVRFNRNARVETHEVEYLGDSPTEYLRIEFKTTPGPPHRDARLRSDGDFPWEDSQVRISRIHGTPPRLTRRTILVSITERTFTWLEPGNAPALTHEPAWLVMLELKSGK